MQSNSAKEFKKVVKKAHELLILNGSPNECSAFIKDIIDHSETKDRGLVQWLGLSYMEANKFDLAKRAFESGGFYYQAGYCELLLGNLGKAKNHWKKQPESSVKDWSRALETMVQGRVEHKPTYLALRNYLEMDIGYLLKANQTKFAENIVNITIQLAEINLECLKFAGRALLHNGYANLAVNLLLDGQKILPSDPEIYYHLGQYSLTVGAYNEARSMFSHCKMLSPSYTPADDRLNEMFEKNL